MRRDVTLHKHDTHFPWYCVRIHNVQVFCGCIFVGQRRLCTTKTIWMKIESRHRLRHIRIEFVRLISTGKRIVFLIDTMCVCDNTIFNIQYTPKYIWCVLSLCHLQIRLHRLRTQWDLSHIFVYQFTMSRHIEYQSGASHHQPKQQNLMNEFE